MRLLRRSERNELYGRKSQCVSHVMLGVVIYYLRRKALAHATRTTRMNDHPTRLLLATALAKGVSGNDRSRMAQIGAVLLQA